MVDNNLKKHVISLINDNMEAHIVKDILSIKVDDTKPFVIIECEMMNGKIKKCAIDKKIINIIQKPLIRWI